MTQPSLTDTAAAGQRGRASKRPRRHRPPDPFPVTIVRPATVAVEPLTPAQRARRIEANRMAHEITEAARDGTRPQLGPFIQLPLHRIARAGDIVRDAPALAANPPPGAVRVGRTARGHVVVAVLHATDWSLLLCPAGPRLEVWAFHDDFPDLAIWFYGDGDWCRQFDDMADAVYAALDT
jgi:hypothetical protein